jgi:hypothetical protein
MFPGMSSSISIPAGQDPQQARARACGGRQANAVRLAVGPQRPAEAAPRPGPRAVVPRPQTAPAEASWPDGPRD